MREFAEKMMDDPKGNFIITNTGKHYLNYSVPSNSKRGDYRNGLKGYIAKVVRTDGKDLNKTLKERFNAHIEKDCIWFDNDETANQAAEYMNSLLVIKKLKG